MWLENLISIPKCDTPSAWHCHDTTPISPMIADDKDEFCVMGKWPKHRLEPSYLGLGFEWFWWVWADPSDPELPEPGSCGSTSSLHANCSDSIPQSGDELQGGVSWMHFASSPASPDPPMFRDQMHKDAISWWRLSTLYEGISEDLLRKPALTPWGSNHPQHVALLNRFSAADTQKILFSIAGGCNFWTCTLPPTLIQLL